MTRVWSKLHQKLLPLRRTFVAKIKKAQKVKAVTKTNKQSKQTNKITETKVFIYPM